MYKSIILPLAKEDILEAAKWYNKKSPGLGKRFTAEAREKVRFIRQNPMASNVRFDNVRTAILDIFPYMLHYTIDETSRTVIVSAVFHTSRNPWETRYFHFFTLRSLALLPGFFQGQKDSKSRAHI
jgi:plasmid stabilization system protein ParE